jgi:hypothetical protein
MLCSLGHIFLNSFLSILVQPATQRVAFRGKLPELKCSFVASSATVVGDVKIGEHSSVWYQAVVRGNREDCDAMNHVRQVM